MTDEQVYAGVEKALRKYFGKRGDQVVQDNLTCVKRGYSEMQEIPQDMIHAETMTQRPRAASARRRHDAPLRDQPSAKLASG